MDTDTFNLYSIILTFANLLSTIIGVILLVLTLKATAKSIRKSIEDSSYNVWREIYLRLAEHPEAASLFNFTPKDPIDFHQLSIFLMILDMYANKFSENYTRMSLEPTILQVLMKSETSRNYWKLCKSHFFSNREFIKAIDKIVDSQQI